MGVGFFITAAIISILRGSGCQWGSDNSSHFIYFKRVWMGVGIEEQQSFYLFSEGLDASGGLTTAVILSI